MKFVVKPVDTKVSKFGYTTMCWLCSEDPRACPPTW